MGHQLYRLRSELRHSWRGAVAIAVLLALLAGGALASIAGARRTDSAYPRLLSATNAEDLLVSPVAAPGYDPTGAYAEIEALPGVGETGLMAGIPLLPLEGTPAAELNSDANNSEMSPLGIAVAPLDDRAYRALGRPSIVEGRAPAPDALDEALISRRVADATGLVVGDTLDMVLVPAETDAAGLVAMAGTGRELRLRVVGIGEYPAEVVPFSDLEASGTMLLSEAMGRLVRREAFYFEGMLVDLEPGVDAGDVAGRIDALAERHPELLGSFFVSDRAANAQEVQDGLRPLAVALVAFAIVLGVAAVLVVGQATARHVRPEPAHAAALTSLGLARRSQIGVPIARAAIIGAAGALGAAAVAAALSNRFPIGPARLAEPAPGLRADWPVLLVGAAAIVALAPAAVLPSLLLSGRRHPGRAGDGGWLARRAIQAGLGPAASQGLRFATDARSGARATPTRSTLVASTVAVAAVLAAATFSTSLTALVDTPSRYGQSWDRLVDGEFGPAPAGVVVERYADDPRVEGIAVGSLHQVEVGGQVTPTVSMATFQGGTGPTAIDGRAATAAGEIALGGEVMDRLRAEIGDRVDVETDRGTRSLEVVGEVVFPHFNQGSFGRTGLGEGAQVHTDELGIFLPPEELEFVPESFALDGEHYNFVALELADGDEGAEGIDAELAEMQRTLQYPFLVRSEQRPTTIADLDRVRTVPLLLALLLALSAGALLSHLLVSAVRSHRRDLALLRALGFTRRQLRTAVSWQASTVVVLAAAVGVPVGTALGRTLWTTFADRIHTNSSPVLPALWLALVLPVALLVANVVAAVPGRLASRTRPSVALREE